eukprot:3762403-Pyramimonas_sp.AAC.1
MFIQVEKGNVWRMLCVHHSRSARAIADVVTIAPQVVPVPRRVRQERVMPAALVRVLVVGVVVAVQRHRVVLRAPDV